MHLGCGQVEEGQQVKLDDEVSFRTGLNASTGAYKAITVSLLMTAAERGNKRELGQVPALPLAIHDIL